MRIIDNPCMELERRIKTRRLLTKLLTFWAVIAVACIIILMGINCRPTIPTGTIHEDDRGIELKRITREALK